MSEDIAKRLLNLYLTGFRDAIGDCYTMKAEVEKQMRKRVSEEPLPVLGAGAYQEGFKAGKLQLQTAKRTGRSYARRQLKAAGL